MHNVCNVQQQSPSCGCKAMFIKTLYRCCTSHQHHLIFKGVQMVITNLFNGIINVPLSIITRGADLWGMLLTIQLITTFRKSKNVKQMQSFVGKTFHQICYLYVLHLCVCKCQSLISPRLLDKMVSLTQIYMYPAYSTCLGLCVTEVTICLVGLTCWHF